MASGSNTDGERVTTGSEPRRWTIYACPKHGALARTATMASGDGLSCVWCAEDTGNLDAQRVEQVEVVERGHDERPATREPDEDREEVIRKLRKELARSAGWAAQAAKDGYERGWKEGRAYPSTARAVVDEFANVARAQPVTVKADAIREAIGVVAERFNLKGTDDE